MGFWGQMMRSWMIAGMATAATILTAFQAPGVTKPAPGFESVEWNKTLPVAVEQLASSGGVRAEVAEASLEPGDDPSSYGEDCGVEDMLVLTVSRGGKAIYSETYCSAYQLAMVRLYVDVNGEPFLFICGAAGHGTGATTKNVRIFQIGASVLQVDGFDAGRTIGDRLYVFYDYKVSRPPEGGLVVDTRAMNTRAGVTSAGIPVDACCVEDLPVTEQLRLGAAVEMPYGGGPGR